MVQLPAEQVPAMCLLMRDILMPSNTKRRNQHFAHTGGSMMLVWSAFIKTPANERHMIDRMFPVSITENEDEAVAQATKSGLLDFFGWYAKVPEYLAEAPKSPASTCSFVKDSINVPSIWTTVERHRFIETY